MPAGAPRVNMGERTAICHRRLKAAAGNAHDTFTVT
jgi:hypothetical protein